jgi:hypothetical protein
MRFFLAVNIENNLVNQFVQNRVGTKILRVFVEKLSRKIAPPFCWTITTRGSFQSIIKPKYRHWKMHQFGMQELQPIPRMGSPFMQVLCRVHAVIIRYF